MEQMSKYNLENQARCGRKKVLKYKISNFPVQMPKQGQKDKQLIVR